MFLIHYEKLKHLALLHLLVLAYCAPAQEINHEDKFSPNLKAVKGNVPAGSDLLVIFRSPQDLRHFVLTNKDFRMVTYREESLSAQVKGDKNSILTLARYPGIMFIDWKRRPVEEILVGSFDPTLNRVSTMHHLFPNLNGDGIVISIKENRPDSNDIDIKGRWKASTLSSPIFSAHASLMMTIAAGGENSFYQTRGAGWASKITNENFASLLPESHQYYVQNGISVQNHSYGTAIENFYGIDSRAYDLSVNNLNFLNHVFSAGNSGILASGTGAYSGIPGFANLTGSFKMAKNIITVGHTDSFNVVPPASSKGPAYDGRLAPLLVAYGEDGSSGAAASVSGVSATLQQAHAEQHGMLPSSALIRSILVNTSKDIALPGPDYISGFGSMDASAAMRSMKEQHYFAGQLIQGGTAQFNLMIPTGIKSIKLTLAWNDPAADIMSGKALINDLDLELFHSQSGNTWLPWILSSFPHGDSLTKPARRGIDTLNNVEQITIDQPSQGDYAIRIKGMKIPSGIQQFFVSYKMDTLDRFSWEFPTSSDQVFAASSILVRFNSGFLNTTGSLYYTTDNINWLLINSSINLNNGHAAWQIPDLNTTGRLWMQINGENFYSDEFTISKPPIASTGFDCVDSFLIYWTRLQDVDQYRVYALKEKYLEPLFVTTDSFALFSKSNTPYTHFSVAPVIDGKDGLKSYTFDYSKQGTGCYIKNFLVYLDGTAARLELELGTTYNIARLDFEHFRNGNFVTFISIDDPVSLSHHVLNDTLAKGLNQYRVRIVTKDGRIFYSGIESIYYLFNFEYIIYPVPASSSSSINIVAKNVENDVMEVFDGLGRLVLTMVMDDRVEFIPAGRLGKGLYVARFIRKGVVVGRLKFVVQ